VRKFLVTTLALVLLFAPIAPRAHAQTLDDAIDAELDEVSGGDSPSTAPKATSASKSNAVEDIQLDDGGSSPATAPQTAQAPAPAPEVAPSPEVAPAPEAAAPAPAPVPSEGGPSPGVVEDELKLDDDTTSTAQAPQKSEPSPDVELDNDNQGPSEVAKPTDEAPDLNLEPEKPAVVETKPAPQAAPKAAPVMKPSDVALDNGNSSYEKRLARLARGYKQVPDTNWDEIVGERRQENYRLQRGDTLWDISETFFGDGFFWAKLWSQNGVIGNPHKILKGHGIRFVAGTEADAPAIAVIDKNQNVSTNPLEEPQFDPPDYREQAEGNITQEEIDRGDIETSELIPAPELPPPNKRVAVLKTLPKSIPETHIDREADYDASGLNAPRIAANIAPTVFVNSMILDGKPDEIGRIDEIETQERVAGPGQAVFLNANRELPIGQHVTFIRRRPSPSGAAGPVVDIEGIGVIDGVVKENSNTYHVTITTALFPVEKGAIAITEAPPLVVINRDGHRSDVHVKIVGGEFDDARKLLGSPSVVYLNGGAEAGLHKDDLLGVEAKRGTRRDTKYPTLGRSIAIVKVADVRNKVATAVVVHSIDGIVIGDMTGGDWPEDLSSLHTETAAEAASKFGQQKGSATE